MWETQTELSAAGFSLLQNRLMQVSGGVNGKTADSWYLSPALSPSHWCFGNGVLAMMSHLKKKKVTREPKASGEPSLCRVAHGESLGALHLSLSLNLCISQQLCTVWKSLR